jgi:hypothetical protein
MASTRHGLNHAPRLEPNPSNAAGGSPVSRLGASRGHGQYPAPPQSRTSIGTQSRRYRDFGIDEVDLIKFDCEGIEYLIVSELSASGLMDRIRCIRGE